MTTKNIIYYKTTKEPDIFTRIVGNKLYEINDHLGNVRATVSDRRFGENADLRSSVMYYPFGMPIANRTQSLNYRFGFNGKENDNEVYGNGRFQDYGFRSYMTDIARFASVDPLKYDYPELTTYQFASNTPIWAIDLDGLEAWIATNKAEDVMSQSDWRAFVKENIMSIVDDGKVMDCADVPLYLVAKYYKERGVELAFKHPLTGEILSSNDTRWGNADESAYNKFVWGSEKTFIDYYSRLDNKGIDSKHFLGAFRASNIADLGKEIEDKNGQIGDFWTSTVHVKLEARNAGLETYPFNDEFEDDGAGRNLKVSASSPFRELHRTVDKNGTLYRFNFVDALPESHFEPIILDKKSSIIQIKELK